MPDNEPFPIRFGFATAPPIDNDFPATAKDGLWYILKKNVSSNRTHGGWSEIADELLRLRRQRKTYEDADAAEVVAFQLQELLWDRAYIFCERIYKVLLSADIRSYEYDRSEVVVSIEAVRGEFEIDLNQLFAEEGIVYRMKDGILHRSGNPHFQQVTASAQVVLQDFDLTEARMHFLKARRFFETCPEPDFPNSIKEASSALEAAAKSLFLTKGNDFEKCLRDIRDGDGNGIPPTILNGLFAVYRFRGAGEGVAHGGGKGGKPTAALAEWTLSVVASSVIYLRDIAITAKVEESPF